MLTNKLTDKMTNRRHWKHPHRPLCYAGG